MTKIYVFDPQFSSPVTLPDEAFLCYTLIEWVQGQPGITHPPCNEETQITMAWGDSAVAVKQKIIDNIVSKLGVSSNDIIFIGGWA